MAETAGQNCQGVHQGVLEQIEEPHQVHLNSPARTSADTSAREATELARIRSNYTRASSYHQAGSSIASAKPDGLLECFSHTVRAFWRRQISITVAHSTCRDHLGKLLATPLSIFLPHYIPLPRSLSCSFLGETRQSFHACCLIGKSGVGGWQASSCRKSSAGLISMCHEVICKSRRARASGHSSSGFIYRWGRMEVRGITHRVTLFPAYLPLFHESFMPFHVNECH
ncbi:hypothetical protein BKA61DRAFT_92049 [Leptodontidium sp. MPI-SDFR-AT-0119]|nr:hypothetical protein BKA61DRAFT_92049 [Leptodontidium sp. MPI-SDFR-AT-0119]